MTSDGSTVTRARNACLGLSGDTRGILWLFLYTISFACADTLAKLMGLQINLLVLLFLRYFISLFFIAPAVFAVGVGSLATERPFIHASRATISVAAQLLIYYALVNMYIADVTAIAFSRPLFVTLLAVLILGESVGWQRWAATLVGFVGVFVMVGPTGAGGMELAPWAALLGTLMFGVAMIMVRRFSPTEPPIRFVFYYHLTGAILTLGPAHYFWETPGAGEWAFIVLLAFFSTIAMTFGIRGYSVGEASIVGPIEYFRLVWAALLGYLVFAEIPGPGTWIGAAIIIASTFYIARNEAAR